MGRIAPRSRWKALLEPPFRSWELCPVSNETRQQSPVLSDALYRLRTCRICDVMPARILGGCQEFRNASMNAHVSCSRQELFAHLDPTWLELDRRRLGVFDVSHRRERVLQELHWSNFSHSHGTPSLVEKVNAVGHEHEEEQVCEEMSKMVGFRRDPRQRKQVYERARCVYEECRNHKLEWPV